MKFFAAKVSLASFTMQVLIISSRNLSRFAARALLSPPNARRTAAASFRPLASQYRFKASVASDDSAATVEDDIDAVLDSVLGDVYKKADEVEEFEDDVINHMKGTHPVPSNLVEEVCEHWKC